VELKDHLELINQHDFTYNMFFNNCGMFAQKFMRFYLELSDVKKCDETTMTQYKDWNQAHYHYQLFLQSLEEDKDNANEILKKYEEQKKILTKYDDAKLEKVIQEVSNRRKGNVLLAGLLDARQKVKSDDNEEGHKDWELACLIWDSGAYKDYVDEPPEQQMLKSSMLTSKQLMKASKLQSNQVNRLEMKMSKQLADIKTWN